MVKSLKEKASKGAKWSIIDNLANSGITFLVGLVLARLLTPAEFGVIGIITVFIAIAQTIIDGGFSDALIRRVDVSQDDYNTAFYSNIIISFVLMILIWSLAKPIANFFNLPILKDVIPVMSIILIIGSLSIAQRVVLIRKIDFKTQAYISLIASLGSGVIGISMAFLKFGVWSLVAQQLSRQFFIMLFLWIFSTWKPTLKFSFGSFKELFGFGSKILLSNFINTIYKNGFTFIIGKFYSAGQLGQYSRAEQFNLIATNNLTGVIQKVSFPTLSSIQNDRVRLIQLFRKTLIYSAIVTFPVVFGIAAMAKPMVLLLIGDKWQESILYLQIMCSYGILYPLTAVNLNMLNIEGRSDLILKLEIIKKTLFIPLFFIGYYYSITVLLIAVSIYYYIEFIFNTYYSERFFNYGTRKQIKDLIPIFFISLSVSGAVFLFSFVNLPNIIIFFIQISTSIVLYTISLKIFKIKEFYEIVEIVKLQLSKKQ